MGAHILIFHKNDIAGFAVLTLNKVYMAQLMLHQTLLSS